LILGKGLKRKGTAPDLLYPANRRGGQEVSTELKPGGVP